MNRQYANVWLVRFHRPATLGLQAVIVNADGSDAAMGKFREVEPDSRVARLERQFYEQTQDFPYDVAVGFVVAVDYDVLGEPKQ